MSNASKIYGVLVGHESISFVIDNFQCVFINSNMDARMVENILAVQGFILVEQQRENTYIFMLEEILKLEVS